jgi:hypothetical protein
MGQLSDHVIPHVLFLEPMDEPGWELGLGKKARIYLCSVTPEHAEAAGGLVYWVVGCHRGKEELKGIATLPVWGPHFSLRVDRVTDIPTGIRQETAPWFISPEYEYTWFHISGGGEGLEYNFAVVVYLGLHLRKVAGRRLHCMHLVADMEGKPNARITWGKK